LLAWLALSAVALAQSPPASAIAFVKNNSLTITAKHGEVLDTVMMRPAVSDFSISQDRRSVVVVSNGTARGGELELIDLRKRRRSKLVTSPVYFKALQQQEREVYASPQISPDGEHVVFAVRLDSTSDGTNPGAAAGPLAVLKISDGSVQVMPSTTSIEGRGPCNANTPMWSPDGSKILFNCETGFATTSRDGSKFNRLVAATERKPWSAAIGWLGKRCVLYVQAEDVAAYDTYEVRWLNLTTSVSQDASGLVTRQRAKIAGLSEASSDAAISRTSELTIHAPTNQWVLPRDAPAHLLGGWPRHDVPQSCR